MSGEKSLYLDVRSAEEFEAGGLPGSTNIPIEFLLYRMGELEPRTRPIIVYCRSGRRSALAAKLLRKTGFTQVTDAGAIDNVRST